MNDYFQQCHVCSVCSDSNICALFIYFITEALICLEKKKSYFHIFVVCVCQAGVQGTARAAGGAAEPAAPQPETLPGEGAAALQAAALHSQHAPGRHAARAGAQVNGSHASPDWTRLWITWSHDTPPPYSRPGLTGLDSD